MLIEHDQPASQHSLRSKLPMSDLDCWTHATQADALPFRPPDMVVTLANDLSKGILAAKPALKLAIMG